MYKVKIKKTNQPSVFLPPIFSSRSPELTIGDSWCHLAFGRPVPCRAIVLLAKAEGEVQEGRATEAV